MTVQEPAARPGPVRGLVAAISATTLLGTTIGLGLPLFALVLEARGTGETLIGVNSAAQFLGIMLCAPLAPGVIRRAGLVGAMNAGILGCAACLALLAAFDSFAAWAVVRFAFGGAEGLLFVAGETWINAAIDDRVRGRLVAVYTTSLAAGFALGPLIITATGADGPLPFLVGALVVLSGVVPVLIGARSAPTIAGVPSGGALRLLRAMPVAAAAAALFGVLDGGMVALLAVYGLSLDLEAPAAARLVTTLAVGAIVLQLPLGWLADRTDRRAAVAGSAAAGTVLLLAVAAFGASPIALHVLLFAIGGLLGSFWMFAMTLLGERFRGADLAAGNVGLTLAYGVGSVAGPALGGVAMELWSPHGLMAAMAAATGAFALSVEIGRRRTARPAAGA
ncbi:MAG TPA: MFS transporter [Alphaproteobacteria bacterium]